MVRVAYTCTAGDRPVKKIFGSGTWKLSPAVFSHAVLDHPVGATLGGKINAPAQSHEWKCISPPLDLPLKLLLLSSPVPWSSATALVDGVLYFHQEYCPDFLVAYDVMTKSWLKVVHSSPFHVAYRVTEFLNMLHFGNDMLCLTCSGYDNTHEDKLPTTRVQFAKFRVKSALILQRCMTLMMLSTAFPLKFPAYLQHHCALGNNSYLFCNFYCVARKILFQYMV
ncbi:hypothetical protein POM88_048259 [Heracleum sosnowskyi]|uniref:Uncharacterized protein n=1 Tax=Heracleum sosnowskyi TaxID=360622 RepID=A0AAD8GVV9_9APIA|nr:hypothetical protein POM88_048259 [Heracleum sosnowskyi]